MKRFVLILLLVMMPLQAAWASAASYCDLAERQAAEHPGHHGHQGTGDAQAAPADAPDQDAKDKDCDLCHHLAASALPSVHPDLPLPKGAPHLRGELRRYVSHIPELVPPPDRPIRI